MSVKTKALGVALACSLAAPLVADERFGGGATGDDAGYGSDSVSVYHILDPVERAELEARIEELEEEAGILRNRADALNADIATLHNERNQLNKEIYIIRRAFGY